MAEFERSGLTLVAFCDELGVSTQRMSASPPSILRALELPGIAAHWAEVAVTAERSGRRPLWSVPRTPGSHTERNSGGGRNNLNK